MNKDIKTIEKVKGRIRFLLRQADGQKLPNHLPITPYIAELVDEKTAQELYEEVIMELETTSGLKIPRF